MDEWRDENEEEEEKRLPQVVISTFLCAVARAPTADSIRVLRKRVSSRTDRFGYGDTGTEVERGRKSVEMKVLTKGGCGKVVVPEDECLPVTCYSDRALSTIR